MKAARFAAILIALSILFSCELFNSYGRENPKDPLNPNYAGWFGIKTVDSTNDVGKYASMKVLGGNVFISYFDAMIGHTKFARSFDGGISWETTQVDFSADTAGNPSAIAIRPNASLFDITLIYQDGLYLRARKSTDSGATWVSATTQPHVSSPVLQHCSLAAGTGADDSYYASYYVQAGNPDLYFAKSVAGSANWNADTVADSSTDDCGKFNSIAVSGSAVFIAYRNSTAGVISMVNSTTGGTGFLSPVIVGGTSTGALGGTSVVATDTTNVYVVYFDGNNLAFAKSSNGGGSFPTPAIVSTGGGISPSIAVSAGKIYVSQFHATSGDLLFTRSDDFGATWITPPVVVDMGLGLNSIGKSTSIAVDGTNVYIAYYDATNGDLKIAKSINSGDTW
jgi:hypothetical protein